MAEKDYYSDENLGKEPKSKTLSMFPFIIAGLIFTCFVLVLYNGVMNDDSGKQKQALEQEKIRQQTSAGNTERSDYLKDGTTAVYQGKKTELLDDKKVTNVQHSSEDLTELKKTLAMQQAEIERLKKEKLGKGNNQQGRGGSASANDANIEAQAIQNMKRQIADMKKQAFISALTSSSKPKSQIGSNPNGSFDENSQNGNYDSNSRKAQMQSKLNNIKSQIASLNAGDTGTGTSMGGFSSSSRSSPASQLSSSNHMIGYSEPTSSEGKYDLNSYDQMSKQNGWTLNNSLETPTTSYIVRAGFVIPATLISGINSDIAGQIIGQVSQNVYDTATGKYILIPQGTRLVGTYSAGASYGQERIMIAWNRLVFPDNKTLDIGSMSGTDLGGYSGFHDKVNNHWWKLISSAFLMSGITAGVVIATDNNKNSSNSNSSSNTANDQLRQAMATQFGNVISRVIERNLNVSPTLEIRAGYEFNVMVTRDLVFKTPYRSFDYEAEGL